MTESEWLECADPKPMLKFLRGKVSDRKLRLFACACCRRIWPLLSDERSRRAVEVGERFADSLASNMELDVARIESTAAIPRRHPSKGVAVGGKEWREAKVRIRATRAAWNAVLIPVGEFYARILTAWVAQERGLAWTGEYWQCRLLRDLFGNPFRTITFDPSWLSPTVKTLVQRIYDDRTFKDLPILAMALEIAGCAVPEILAHLRGPGPHVRGCWVVDLVLGKE